MPVATDYIYTNTNNLAWSLQVKSVCYTACISWPTYSADDSIMAASITGSKSLKQLYIILYLSLVRPHIKYQVRRQGGVQGVHLHPLLDRNLQTTAYKMVHFFKVVGRPLVCDASTWALNLNSIKMYMCTYITCPLARILLCAPPPSPFQWVWLWAWVCLSGSGSSFFQGQDWPGEGSYM